MSDGGTNTKPRLAGRGFAQSTCRLVASLSYRIGMPSANACLSFLPVAFDGAGRGTALLWGAVP